MDLRLGPHIAELGLSYVDGKEETEDMWEPNHYG